MAKYSPRRRLGEICGVFASRPALGLCKDIEKVATIISYILIKVQA
ncbi:MAG: hypothetical protein QXF04_02360 [Candidatus Aenigmatarchaeota archaeon]